MLTHQYGTFCSDGSAAQPDRSPCPLPMSAGVQLGKNRTGQEMFRHLGILKERRTRNLAKRVHSDLMDG